MSTMTALRWVDGPALTEEQWAVENARVEPILAARNWMALNKNTTRLLLAERDGTLVGFLIFQLVGHCEPLWVDKSERATGLAETLADTMLDFLHDANARGWMLVANSPAAAKLAEERGMRKLEDPVYVGGN